MHKTNAYEVKQKINNCSIFISEIVELETFKIIF